MANIEITDRDISKEPALPKCPNCSAQPVTLAQNTLPGSPGFAMGLIWCTACGHIVNAQTLAMQMALPSRVAEMLVKR